MSWGVEGLAENLKDGDLVIVDGGAGVVLVNPRDEVIDEYRAIQREDSDFRAALLRDAQECCATTDGRDIHLFINISQAEELQRRSSEVADGVGLYRTEFELMNRDAFPDEEALYQVYRQVVEQCGKRSLTIRTMDIGSEKKLNYLKMPDEENHALGLRSIRLASRIEEYQQLQLRAILRAAYQANVRVMFPFITTVEDIRLAKRMLRQAARQLKAEGVPFKEKIDVGMMVEVPAVALSIDRFAREVQFFSVGTNDLTQYVCAADRNQAEVANWYKGHNPGMLSLLKSIVDTAKKYDRDLTICGEMAGDPFYTLFLLGIGVRNLSMSAPQIPIIKRLIRSVDYPGARNVAERALRMGTTTQVRNLFADTVERILGPLNRAVYTQNN